MPFAAALSLHPNPSEAAGELIGQLVDRYGPSPDLAVLFVTTPHRDAFRGLCRTVRSLLRPVTLLGATAVSVIGGAQEAEDVPAISLWAAWGIGEAVPLRIVDTVPGVPGLPDGADRTLLLVADPFSFAVDRFLEDCARDHPGTTVVGGLASAAPAPGGNLLALDDEVFDHGAVAVAFDADVVPVVAVVSQGCRPIGAPYTVTRAVGNVLGEMGGRPPLARLQEIADQLAPEDRERFARGVHLGRVIDEHRGHHERGDFLVRSVLGVDRRSGALVVGDDIEVGATVQFQVRDAGSADDDLRLRLAGLEADAALIFTCNGRGRHLFDEGDHDATVVTELLATGAVGGMFCAGELGPVGGRTFLHGYTASVALFRDPPEDRQL